ncbi:MAG TPA: threonyl-tRNA synthetase editing domain-containing protein [Candidatus Lokiarchaeia archaeon]
MRFLSFHVDFFRYNVTTKGRSTVIEDITEENKKNQVQNALVLFISMDKSDEANAEILEKGINEIEKITKQLKISNIVIIPFAHLFGQLSSLEYAFESFKNIESLLKLKSYSVLRLPFGWFNELEMKAKGHPLSRISRIVE